MAEIEIGFPVVFSFRDPPADRIAGTKSSYAYIPCYLPTPSYLAETGNSEETGRRIDGNIAIRMPALLLYTNVTFLSFASIENVRK